MGEGDEQILGATSYSEAEERFRQTAAADLPALAAADAATETLARVIAAVRLEPAESDPPPPAYWRARALLYLAVLAVRTTRAAMAVLTSGYEAEAMGFKRTLMEAHARAVRVVKDESGEYARQWLQGRAGKPAKAVGGHAPDDLWEMLAHSSHADHRAVENFLAVPNPDGSTSLVAAPERRPEVSNATLAVFAGEVRDVACMLARECGVVIPNLAELDALIAHHPPYREDTAEPTQEERPGPAGAGTP